jgi:putative acetyltransferase
MITVRLEQSEDITAVRMVNETAFGQSQEAKIVDAIRATCRDAVSFVALSDGQIVGHIFFSPVVVTCTDRKVSGMGLAPMAVLPAHQYQGIGSRLVRAGLEILRQRSCPYVVVLGHPEYYPRFGFVPASRHGIVCQWEGVPDGAFRARSA